MGFSDAQRASAQQAPSHLRMICFGNAPSAINSIHKAPKTDDLHHSLTIARSLIPSAGRTMSPLNAVVEFQKNHVERPSEPVFRPRTTQSLNQRELANTDD